MEENYLVESEEEMRNIERGKKKRPERIKRQKN